MLAWKQNILFNEDTFISLFSFMWWLTCSKSLYAACVFMCVTLFSQMCLQSDLFLTRPPASINCTENTIQLNRMMPFNPSLSRAKDRSSSVLGRPEFLSLNQPLRNSRASRRANHWRTHQCENLPEPESTKERKEPSRLPDEDCMLLNPSFKGIAINSLLAIDICLSKCLGVCVHSSSSWGSVRSMVTLLALTGHGLTWICGTLVCLMQSNTPAGQEVLINLLIGELNSVF